MRKENKEKLKNALIEVANREADEAAASDSQQVHLSLSFQEKARKLIQETDGHRCRVSRRAVVLIAAAMIISLCSVAAYTCREHVLSFVDKTFKDHKTVTVEDQHNNRVQMNTTVETVYTLGYVPEGYKEIKFEKRKIIVQTVWENEEGNTLILVQEALNNNNFFDTEKSECENINSAIILHSCNEQQEIVAWIDSSYQYKLYWTGLISEKEIQSILSGITERN